MDFLGIKESTASRPSLISSIWSLQVQPQVRRNKVLLNKMRFLARQHDYNGYSNGFSAGKKFLISFL